MQGPRSGDLFIIGGGGPGSAFRSRRISGVEAPKRTLNMACWLLLSRLKDRTVRIELGWHHSCWFVMLPGCSLSVQSCGLDGTTVSLLCTPTAQLRTQNLTKPRHKHCSKHGVVAGFCLVPSRRSAAYLWTILLLQACVLLVQAGAQLLHAGPTEQLSANPSSDLHDPPSVSVCECGGWEPPTVLQFLTFCS